MDYGFDYSSVMVVFAIRLDGWLATESWLPNCKGSLIANAIIRLQQDVFGDTVQVKSPYHKGFLRAYDEITK